MAQFPVSTQQVKILSRSVEISAYLALPEGRAAAPGIIVLQEIFGVNSHIRAVTERIASMGYVAIAPALFDRQAPGLELGYTPEDITIGRSYAERTNAELLLADIQSAIDYLKTLPQVSQQFGCIGFCFGGHVAYLAATLPDISVTASFYGRGITTFTFGDGEPSVSKTSSISQGERYANDSKIYLFFGMEDASIPPEHIAAIDAALTQHQIPHQIWQYPGAEHGFCCDARASYNPTAATDAWQHVEELFGELARG